MGEYVVSGPDGSQYKITADTDEQAAAAMDSIAKANTPSAPEAFGRGALRNFPLAQQATAALEPGDYSENIKDLVSKAETAKSAHKIAYGAGAVTGAAAPLLIPGVGEGLAAAPMLGNAALGASDALSDTDLTKNPADIAKKAIGGGLIGGAVGKLLPNGKAAAEGLEEYASRKGVQALNLHPGSLGVPDEELADLGHFADQLGLVKGSTQERVQQVNDLLQQTGSQIGDVGAGSAKLSPEAMSDAINNLSDKANDSAKFFGSDANADLNMYRQGMANLQNNGQSFEGLQALKTAYGEKAFKNGQVVNDAAANIYGQIKDSMKSIIKESPEQYQDLMTSYGQLKDIQSGLTKQLQNEQAKGATAKGFGMAGKMVGMLGQNPAINIGAAAALAPVHPFMALGALTPLITNPQSMTQAAQGLSKALPAVANAAKPIGTDLITSHLYKAPQVFGKFAQPLLQAAQKDGNSGVAATHFILSQQYPEYNEITQHLATKGSTDNE